MNENIKILIVENEIIISHHLKLELTQEGYKIRICASGEEALVIAKEEKPDLIILDIKLSGKIDGIKTAEKINKSSKIPIIFVTGYSRKELANRLRKIKFIAYFEKPFSMPDLKTTISSALES